SVLILQSESATRHHQHGIRLIPFIFVTMKKFGLAVFASGNGSNAEEIMRYFRDHPSIAVKVVLSNNPTAGVLARAERFNIPAVVFNRAELADQSRILDVLARSHVTHVVLAGFLWLVPGYLIDAYPNRIVN